MPRLAIVVGDYLFGFASEHEWVSTAKFRFERAGVRGGDTICIDKKGRVCTRGGDFQRAEIDGAYPIEVYALRLGVNHE